MDFLSGITIAVVASFLSAWLTLRRFRTERWWERKAEAYIHLVEALHEMSLVPSEEIAAGSGHRKELTEDEKAELWESFERAKKKVWKIADSSDFIISSDVLAVIQEMNRGLGHASHHTNWIEFLDDSNSAINECLNKVKKIGAVELGIKKGPGWDRWVPAKIKAYIDDFKLLVNNRSKKPK
ncbi:hypothetical protein KUV35_07990 [Marinobacter salsuginis]|uniref:hypothetical protein n=1 Tax=Marinobacter salsuginis TaxID=418719 RepID=UPI001C95B4F6|nr:hypothetical protein [Marinobacter salsuginis]MBY6071228.1 hypothetical protein [Marinobacter salsuginis]